MYKKILTIAFVLTAIVTFVAKAQVVEDGLVSYWTCDSTAGDVLEDAWGENDGTVFGNPQTVAGKIGNAIEFGENKYVEMPDHESFNFGDGGFTLSAWINIGALPAAGWARIVGRHTQGPPRHGLSIVIKVMFQVNGTFVEGSTRLSPGQWYHIVGVREGAVGKIYVNGVLDKEGEVDSASVDPESDGEMHFCVKGTKAGDWFMGVVDEVSIYNRALSDAEVAQNFEAVEGPAAVSSAGKLTSTWGKIKVSK